MKIEKNTTIGELLEKNPEKAQILLDAGLPCLTNGNNRRGLSSTRIRCRRNIRKIKCLKNLNGAQNWALFAHCIIIT